MSMAEKIRIMRIKCGNISERELAERMGMTPQNLNNKMRRDDFKINELEKIANTMGYKIVINFVNLENGEEFQ